MKKVYFYIFGIVIISAIAFIPVFAQQPPICINSSGHLIWPNQNVNLQYIPFLSIKDTLSNSPLYVKGTNVMTTGDVCRVEGNSSKCLSQISASGGIGGISGSGKTNYIPKWTAGSTLVNSVIYESAGNKVGIGTINPQYKLDIQGSFRVVDSSGQERLVIKDTGASALNSNKKLQAQSKSTLAQTASSDKWIQLFGGSAYFLKQGANSDMAFQVGDTNTNKANIRLKGKSPKILIKNENEQVMTTVQYYIDPKTNKGSTRIQNLKGLSVANPNVPFTEIELANDQINNNLPSLKLKGGIYPNSQLILEITSE